MGNLTFLASDVSLRAAYPNRNNMNILIIDSPEQLHAVSDQWNELWLRSEATMPTLRAEHLLEWLDFFAPDANLFVTVVEREGRFLAALPMIESKKAGCLRIGELPSNSWSTSGDLLLDETQDETAINETLNELVAGIRNLPWHTVLFDKIPFEQPRWIALQQALKTARLKVAKSEQFHVGLIDCEGTWETYQASWSGNHRHAVRKSDKRLRKAGETAVIRHRNFPDASGLRQKLKVAFDIENLGWKAEAGSSVLKNDGMFEFYTRQANLLANRSEFELIVLEHEQQVIAFEFCFVAKDVCYSNKISYDPAFSKFGPGRLLRYLQLQEYFEDPNIRVLDTLGILCDTKAKWCNRSYPMGKLVVETGSARGKAVVGMYQHVWPSLKKLRGKEEPYVLPKLGAETKPALESVESTAG